MLTKLLALPFLGVVTTSSTGKRYEAEDAALTGRAGDDF